MKKPSTKQIILLASLIFGMFFGAGNLIFPAHLGQLAGENWLSAGTGFLISATLLPLAALLALSQTQSKGIYDIAKPVGKGYGLFFLILTHLALGPLFATPRTAALGYQFSFGNFLPKEYEQIGLLVFSGLFFGLAYYFSIREASFLKIIGKLLNPAFLILLCVLFIVALVQPFGNLNQLPDISYRTGAVVNGFLEGYNTMDALAALAFGVTIIRTICSLGVKSESEIARQTIKSGLLAMLITAIVYIGIIALGTMSLNKLSISENGGIALTQIIKLYFGNAGILFMGIMTNLAVFTTAMGLITSFAQDFAEHFPIFSYKNWLRITTISSFAVANFGLNTIITWTLPFLMVLYPLAMALILPGVLSPLFNNDRQIYRWTTVCAIIPALFDGLGALPIENQKIEQIMGLYKHWVPFASNGLGWLLPTMMGLGVSLVIYRLKSNHQEVVELSKE